MLVIEYTCHAARHAKIVDQSISIIIGHPEMSCDHLP